MIKTDTPWGELEYTEPVLETDVIKLGGREVVLGSAVAHTNGAILDFVEPLVGWRGGRVSTAVWEVFWEHLEDPRAVQEMLDLVGGGGSVLEIPPYLASLVQ